MDANQPRTDQRSQAIELACLGNALQELGRYEEAVASYEIALRICPDWPEAHNNLGMALRALDRYDEAVKHYEAALRLQPAYPEALNNFGSVLFALHRYEDAMAYYSAALALAPRHVTARNNLGLSLQELGRLDEALGQHEAALASDPSNAQVHQALAILHLKRGDMEAARRHGRLGFGSGIEQARSRGGAAPVAVLVLTSALGGAVRLDPWLKDPAFARRNVTMEFWDEESELPPHHLVVNTIGDADRCGYALQAAARLVERTTAPVINQPSRVQETGRTENARRLGKLAGVVTPRILRLRRELLLSANGPAVLAKAGLDWPLLLRTPGYHTGEHFERVDGLRELAPVVAGLPGEELLAIQYIDTYSPDGSVRKYRVLMVDGQLFPLHLAVARSWKVHFMTADMTGSPEHRAEDARFLADMPGMLGPKVMLALQRVRNALSLDYGGIDFGIDAEGRLVVWEANATMVAPPPTEDECWDYRRPAIERVHAAVRDMLLRRARGISEALEAVG
jgi:Flp pilus assembly protein TadD